MSENKAGRPPMFESVKELQDKIDEYMETKGDVPIMLKNEEGKEYIATDKHGEAVYKINPPTVAGLALYLGFANRASIYDYQKKEEFTHTIKRAIASIEEFAEEKLYSGKPTGAIFWLKNHGWIDKVEKDITVSEFNLFTDKVKDKEKNLDKA